MQIGHTLTHMRVLAGLATARVAVFGLLITSLQVTLYMHLSKVFCTSPLTFLAFGKRLCELRFTVFACQLSYLLKQQAIH